MGVSDGRLGRLAARSRPAGKPAAYRSVNGGKTWQRQATGLPKAQAWWTVKRQAMTADQAPTVGVYFGTTSGEVWGSRDEGRSWKCLARHLPHIYAIEVRMSATRRCRALIGRAAACPRRCAHDRPHPGPAAVLHQGVETVEVATAATLAEALAALDARFPGLRFRIVDEQAAIRPHIKLFVDGVLARNLSAAAGLGRRTDDRRRAVRRLILRKGAALRRSILVATQRAEPL